MAEKKTSSDQRKARLAKSLKANIAKRKEQAKARQTASTAQEMPENDDGCPN